MDAGSANVYAIIAALDKNQVAALTHVTCDIPLRARNPGGNNRAIPPVWRPALLFMVLVWAAGGFPVAPIYHRLRSVDRGRNFVELLSDGNGEIANSADRDEIAVATLDLVCSYFPDRADTTHRVSQVMGIQPNFHYGVLDCRVG